MLKFKDVLRGMAVASALAIAFVSMPENGSERQTVEAVTQSQGYQWDNVKIVGGGGYVVGVIYSPTEEGLVYARTDMGGVYRRDKKTQEWIPLTDWVSHDEWNLLGGESIAIDPVDTNRVYVAAGTYTNSWTNMNGYILRSDDYGKTWERFELPFKFGGNMPGRNCGERLMVDPNSPNILYFAARSGNGLWKSTDYGETWAQVKSFTNVGNYIEDPAFEYSNDNLGLTWVTFDSAKSKNGQPTKDIYVGVSDKENPIYVSHDAGVTWNPLEGQPTESTFTQHNFDEGVLKIGIPFHGVISSDAKLYVTYGNRGGPYNCTDGAIYCYDTLSGEWTDITPPSGYDWSGTPEYKNYYGYGGISVDASDPNVILATSLQSWYPDNQIYRSIDGGKTWKQIWSWGDSWPSRKLNYTMDISKAPWLSWGKELTAVDGGLVKGEAGENPNPKLGWMMGDIEINPFDSNEMLYGTGATLYGCDNLTDWDKDENINIYVKGVGIEETAVLSLICPPVDGVELISGVGDICGFVHEDVTLGPECMMTGPTFTSTTGLDYAGLNSDIIVRVGNIDKEKYEMIKKSVAISKDGGATWSEVQPNISYTFSADSEDEIIQGGTVAVAADGSTFVWSPETGPGVVCYVNGGWKFVDTLPKHANVCSDRVNPDVFYGYADGTFYVSTDGGLTFSEKNTDKSLPASAKIKAVPGEEGHVWIPGSTGMFYTTDGGATVNKSSDVVRSDVVGFGKGKTGSDYLAIYMCGEVDGIYGVYRSDDMAKSWIRINDDAHQYGSINYAITGDLREFGTVYFGTNGRGVICGKLVGAENPVESSTTTTTTTSDKPSETIYGDINCDGEVTPLDIVPFLKHFLNAKLSGQAKVNADVLYDGEIKLTDLATLKQYCTGDKVTLGPLK